MAISGSSSSLAPAAVAPAGAPGLPIGQPHSGLTLVHVTHEGVEHLGGIGTVLDGLLTSPVYQRHVGRSILVGPLPHAERRVARPIERLGDHAVACFYSGPDDFDPHGLGALLKPVEWSFGVRIVYGTRRFGQAGMTGGQGQGELLLIDVTNPNRERLAALKWLFFERFNLDSRRYEQGWDYEEWCRLADPAYHALCVLLGAGVGPGKTPAVVIGHEFMGVCTALRCLLDRARFRTVFHAHECATARRIVEHLPGHDVAFYPAMREAMERGRWVADVFGDQSDFSRHALVERTGLLDAILAVGPETAQELRFLGPAMADANIQVAYNGLPAPRVTMADKHASRARVNAWLRNVVGFVPDHLITHVTRPVPSKGLWRDQKVGAALRSILEREGRSAVYVLLTCGAPVRTREQVDAMAREYGWPNHHREGLPDLSGPEVGLYRVMSAFNGHTLATVGAGRRAGIHALLVNQFGFSAARLGAAAPDDLTIDDLRRAADAELGLSTYEPFGIAHLEALHAGAVCLPSTVCGCLGLVRQAMSELGMAAGDCPLVLPGEFTRATVSDPVRFSAHDRDALEDRVCAELAAALAARLPRDDAQRERYLALGQTLAQRMSWDVVVERDLLPVLRRITAT